MLPQDVCVLWEFLFFPSICRMWLKNVIFAENCGELSAIMTKRYF